MKKNIVLQKQKAAQEQIAMKEAGLTYADSLAQRYKFIELIGQGAFGQVLKAIDKQKTEGDNLVAIKM